MKFENNNICPIYLFCVPDVEFLIIKESVRSLGSCKKL